MSVGNKRKLNLGCGPGAQAVDGWINLDGSWNAWLTQYPFVHSLLQTLHLLPQHSLDMQWGSDILIHDVTNPLPFPADSLDACYMSHLLEHLYLDEAGRLLKECCRVLKPNGVLRVVVPDLRAAVFEYLGQRTIGDASDETITEPRADRLNRQLGFRPPVRPGSNVLMRVYMALKDFHTHKWMYDTDSLVFSLQQAGFGEVTEMPFHISRIEDIAKVEQAGRVLNGTGICVEGVKVPKTERQDAIVAKV